MAKDTILIVTNKMDEHASHVIARCNARGIPVFRLNTEDVPSAATIVWRGERWEIRYHDRTLTPERVQSCWYRRPSDAELHPDVDPTHRTFVQDECRFVLNGLYRTLDDIPWVSHPDALQAAKYKPHQLHVARRLGFAVPDTLWTNDPDAFRAFWDAHHGNIIVKIAGRGPTTIPADQAIYTSPVTRDALAYADAVRFAPHCFQAYVEKAYEVRVTIIGERVFAVRIDSQASERTRVDWRHYDFANVPHTAIDLPTDIAEHCRSFLARYGLAFGALDFIVTPAGDWVFLECNPNGQWLWLEDLTGLPMTAAIIETLTSVMTE